MLRLNNVEVLYNDVILVLKGLSLEVREGQIENFESEIPFDACYSNYVWHWLNPEVHQEGLKKPLR